MLVGPGKPWPHPPLSRAQRKGWAALAVGGGGRRLGKSFSLRRFHALPPCIRRLAVWSGCPAHLSARCAATGSRSHILPLSHPSTCVGGAAGRNDARSSSRRGLLGRDPARLRRRPHHGEPEQRRSAAPPDPRARPDDPRSPVQQRAAGDHMWQTLEPRIESVRRDLAAEFGCDPEEMAITRNASEANETMIFGLDLKRGRRGPRHQPELPADAHLVGPAGAARRHRPQADLVQAAAAVATVHRRPVHARPSRRGPGSSKSPTSPT